MELGRQDTDLGALEWTAAPETHISRYLCDSHARGTQVNCRQYVLTKQRVDESDDPRVPGLEVCHDRFSLPASDSPSSVLDYTS